MIYSNGLKFLFDFLVPENLDSMLLKLCELLLPSAFFRVERWFDFTNFVTEIKKSQQYVVLYTNMSYTLVF